MYAKTTAISAAQLLPSQLLSSSRARGSPVAQASMEEEEEQEEGLFKAREQEQILVVKQEARWTLRRSRRNAVK
jgi:hypothetical protein